MVAVLSACPLTGCSLIDGWGGLEGGDAGREAASPTVDASDAATTSDAGGYDGAVDSGEAGGDAAAGGDSSASILCGGQQCSPSMSVGCCFDLESNSATCTSSASCGSTGGFFTCDTSAQCASFGANASCCFAVGGNGMGSATCAAGQCTGGTELCSGPGATCPQGETCKTAPEILPPGYSICM